MKTSFTLNGNTIPYSTAYHALHSESQAARTEVFKDFQLIIPYLDRLTANNPGLVIDYTKKKILLHDFASGLFVKEENTNGHCSLNLC
jgi:hypothetical protein